MLLGTLAILATSLSISFLCSLVEACLLSLSKAEVLAIGQERPRVGAVWSGFKRHIHGPLAAILILNTAALTIGTSLAAERFALLYGARGVLVSSVLITFVMVQWAELLPKTLGSRHRRRLAVLVGGPLRVAVLALAPVVAVVRWLNRPFEGPGREPPTSIEEIRALAHDARAANVIGPHDDAIIERASGLTRVEARKIMVPRGEMSLLSTHMSLEEALIHAHLEAHTRFPLCEVGDIDKIVGYVNLKELVAILHTNPAQPTLRGITRPIHRVSADANLSVVLKDFVEHHLHVAVVCDEQGKTLGMITMEDLVEQLVGDLAEEFEPLPRRIHDLGGDVLMVGGGASVAEVVARAGLVGEPHGTVASWIADTLQRTPRPGDELSLLGARVVVRRIRRGRVFDVTVKRG
jgi:CBS domain containing-hemolysin-like protein